MLISCEGQSGENRAGTYKKSALCLQNKLTALASLPVLTGGQQGLGWPRASQAEICRSSGQSHLSKGLEGTERCGNEKIITTRSASFWRCDASFCDSRHAAGSRKETANHVTD